MSSSVNILALDTSGDRSTVGLRTATGETFESETDASRKHGRDLLPCIRDLLRASGVRPMELTLIGVGLGPGSYTGLRIGLTAARTLAFAAGARLVGFDSMEAVAANAPADALRVLVVGDAQRGDVYAAEFARATAGEPLSPIDVSRIEPLAVWGARLAPGALVLGPGLRSPGVRANLGDASGVDPDAAIHRPTGGRIIEATLRVAETRPFREPGELEPNYLRRSAAEDQWDARAARP